MEFSTAITLLDVAKSIYTRQIKHMDFKSIFTKSGQSVITLVTNDKDDFAEKIKILFSDENLQELASRCQDKNGYELLDFVVEDLRNFFNTFDLSGWDLERYLAVFENEFIHHLEKNCPDLYNQYYAKETREILHEDHQKIMEEINFLRNLLTDVEQYGFTLYEAENFLKNGTGDYEIDLDFFDYDEKQIDECIATELKKSKVLHVKFRSREEGKYYILRVIKYYLPELTSRVLIVEQQEQWQKLTKIAKNMVLIPAFVANRIKQIPGNTTIFIHTAEDENGTVNQIEVPNRLKSNLLCRLNSYVNDVEKTNRLIEETSGVYPTLMRRLSNDYIKNPDWVSGDADVLIPAALLGAWSDVAGDREVLSELAGEDYDTYITKLKSYLRIEEPFMIRYASLTGTVYKVADIFEAIACLKDKITKNVLQKLSVCAKDVLLSQHAAINDLGICEIGGRYSFPLKKGMATVLVAMALDKTGYNDGYYENLKSFVQNLVETVMNELKTGTEWEAVSELLPLLMEASPVAVLGRIEKAINSGEKGFWQLFAPGKDIFRSYVFGDYVLHALSVALFLEDVSVRALLVLECIAGKGVEDKRHWSAAVVINTYFLETFQGNPELDDKNIKLMYDFVAKHPQGCWNVLNNFLPALFSSAFQPLSKPVYSTFDIITKQEKYDRQLYFESVKKYFDIAFVCAGNDLKKWEDFFDSGLFIKIGLLEKYVTDVNRILANDICGDEEKYQFERAIRRFLHNKRYLGENSGFDKNELDYIEEHLLGNIHYKNSVYKVLYAFDEIWMDIHPFTIDEEKDGNYCRNFNKRNDEQKRLLAKNMEAKRFVLNDLLEKALDDDNLGRNIFTVCHKGVFDTAFVFSLYKKKKLNIMHGYMVGAFGITGNENIFSFLKQLNESYSEIDFKFQILESHKIDDDFLLRIQKFDAELSEYYWTHTRSVWFDENEFNDVEKYVLNTVKHGNFYNALRFVYRYDFDIETYLVILFSVIRFYNQAVDVYAIQQIFKKLYKFENVDNEYADIIMQLETAFLHIFYDDSPRYLKERLKWDPLFSVTLLSYIYREEHREFTQKGDDAASGDMLGRDKRKRAKDAYDIFLHVKFCPCEKNGSIDEIKLSKWCEDFLIEIEKIDRQKIGYCYLGRFLANCPADREDNSWPLPAVCAEIEKRYLKEFWTEFRNDFIIGVLNNRGVHVVNSGKEELKLAEKYEVYAQKADLLYPATASLLREIRNNYRAESHMHRSRAEFE